MRKIPDSIFFSLTYILPTLISDFIGLTPGMHEKKSVLEYF